MLNANQNKDAVSGAHSWRWRILASIGASTLILLLLWWLVSSGDKADDLALFKKVLSQTVWWLASIYIVTTIMQTVIRALRYQSLLKAEGVRQVPGTLYMFMITLARNMFVDMVPARVGEASYVIMLNRGYNVPFPACFSTLFISMVLDMLALAIIMVAIVIAAVFSATEFNISLLNALVATSLIILVAGLLVFASVPLSQLFSRVLALTRVNILKRFGDFVVEVGLSIRRVQQREMLSLTLTQSLAIRVFKYGGLYILFMAVTLASFTEFSSLPWWQVLPAFISAEAAASLPLPTFMSFGSYEGGGLLAFSVLGFAAADILMVMFVIHLISQVVDYILGALGLMGFFLITAESR